MVNFGFPFNVFIAHSTIACICSSTADARNARLTFGLASLRTWTKFSCDFNRFNIRYSYKILTSFPWKNFDLFLGNRYLIVFDKRKNNCADLYRHPSIIYENWKSVLGRHVETSALFAFSSRNPKHDHILVV